jgi:hypothetical protein
MLKTLDSGLEAKNTAVKKVNVLLCLNVVMHYAMKRLDSGCIDFGTTWR